MAEGEEWRKKVDTHKMSPEKVKKSSFEALKRPPPHQHLGEVLHQRRSIPYSPYTLAIGGFLIVSAIGYFTLYTLKKAEVGAADVAKVMTGVSKPEDTHPRK